MKNKKRFVNKIQLLIIYLLCAAILCGCGTAALADTTVPTTAATTAPTEVTISDAEKRVIPSPYHFFNVADSYVEEVIEKTRCSLGFDEYPKLAVEAYCTLLVETYGLVKSDIGELGLTLTEYPGTVYFLDPESGATCVKLYWVDTEGLSSILCVELSEDCRQEKREIWDGDISQYQYTPEDWRECEVCKGTYKCRTCHGEGKTREFDYDSWYYEDCPDCEEGICPAGCIGGKVRIKE